MGSNIEKNHCAKFKAKKFKAQLLLLQYWENIQIDSVPKLYYNFGVTNNISSLGHLDSKGT